MAHQHPVYDTDKHFSIDPVTRKITNECGKLNIQQYDHDSERFTFEIPKEVDGHDMSKCNVVQIHYLNIEAANKSNKYAGIYEVDDLQTGTDDAADIVFGSWLISGNATQYVGSLNFVVRFACVADDGTVEYAWNTAIHSTITIGEGICNSDAVATEYADILEQWRQELFNEAGGAIDAINAAKEEAINEIVENYLEENPFSADDKVNKPVDAYGTTLNGNSGQILQTNGDGTTAWVDKPTGGSSGTSDINIKKWFGKKIIVDGSSITRGGSGLTLPVWHSFLKDMFALDTVYDHSLRGSGWFIGGTTTTMDRVADYEEDADAVILMGDYTGAYNYTSGLGTIDDEASLDGMCYARLKYLAETLINKYPLCPIIWVIEPPRASVGETDGLVPMVRDSVQAKYAAVIEEVAEYYGFTHCNLMKNTVFRPWIQANYDATTSDGTHPWNNIQRTMAQVIAETMKRTPLIYNESYVVTPDDSSGGTTEDDSDKTVTALTVKVNGEVFESDTLETVREYLTVKATYNDLSVATVTNYELSGEITAGTSTLTVSYGGVTTTVNVAVTAGEKTTTVELLEQNVTEGYYLTGSDVPTVLSRYGYTDYISVKGGTNITFSGTGGVHGLNCGFMEYDADKNLVQRVDTNYGTYTYTLADNTAYVRCNVKIDTSNTLTYVAP